jgi:hypothetical protein
VPARAWLWLTVVLTGGAFVVAVAVALAPAPSTAPGRGLAWVLFAGSSVHVASTGWLYTLGDVRSYAASRPLRFWRVPAALVLSGALAAGVAGIGGLVAHPALLQLRAGPRLGVLFPVAALVFATAVVAGVALLVRRPAAQRPAGLASDLHGAALAERLLFGAYLGAVAAA